MSDSMDDNNVSMKERLFALFRRPQRDVSDELRFHLDMRIEEARRLGLDEEQARAAALERFGTYGAVEKELLQIDSARERRRGRREWFEDVHRDMRFAARALRRSPAFALTALATLAIAIGANTAIYSVVHAMLIAPLPFRDADRLIIPWMGTLGELQALRPRWQSVEAVAGVRQLEVNFDDGVTATNLQGAVVSDSFLTVLGVAPQLGRMFTADDHVQGSAGVLLLSDAAWRSQFGGDSSIIGRQISIDGSRRTIIGVMPRHFEYPAASVSFWLPARATGANPVGLWTSGGYLFVARLRDHVGLTAATTEFANVMQTQVRKLNPVWDPGPAYTQGLVVRPIRDAIVGETRSILRIVMGCSLLVLLIACINVANLLLARATSRERELTIRAALGGGRRRLLRQLLTESVLLSALGGIIGVALAAAGMRWLVAAIPGDVPNRADIGIHAPALVFALLLVIMTGIGFGLLPALRATRHGSTNALVRSGRGGRGMGHQRVTATLVACEIALAVLVVTTAQLLVRSFSQLRQVDPGFHSARILTARMTPAVSTYGDPAKATAFFETLMARVNALPGVQSVALVNSLPLARPAGGVAMRVKGRFEDGTQRLPWANHMHIVTPGYFDLLGIRVMRGRAFNEGDERGSEPVVMVSEDVARALWPGEDPIGKNIGYPYESPWMTVVGVVPDVKIDNMRDTTVSAIYVPFAQRPLDPNGRARTDFTILSRTAGNPMSVAAPLRTIVTSIDRSIPVTPPLTMEDVVRESVGSARFTTSLVATFALVALFLGAIGIYGVMSYVVGQRAQEMSVRAALGATSLQLHALVLRRAVVLGVAGAAAGVLLALVAVRSLRALLFGVSAFDVYTFATVPVLFILLAMAAGFAPARRASRLSPASVMRAE